MKTTVDFYQFSAWFNEHRPHNFTREGLVVLFDYLEDYESDTGEELDFDPIAICCDFSEYVNIEEFQRDYGDEYETIEDIAEKTLVIPIEDTEGFIIQAF